MSDELREHWDKSVENIPKDKQASGYAITVESHIPRNAVIADIGGGGGADADFFISQGHTVHLLDISPRALAIARERIEPSGNIDRLQTTVYEINQDRLPLADASVDVAYSRLAHHYSTKEQLAHASAEVERILRPNGAAYIVIKSPDDEKEMAYLRSTAEELEMNVFRDGAGIKSRFNKKQLEEILTSAGISGYTIDTYTEDMSNKGDVTKSGNLQQLLTQIRFTKSL